MTERKPVSTPITEMTKTSVSKMSTAELEEILIGDTSNHSYMVVKESLREWRKRSDHSPIVGDIISELYSVAIF